MTQSLVVGARQNGDIQHAPPLMRLQVWYYTDLGKNSEVNRDLAQSFSQAELDGWIIRPAKSTPSAGSSRDKYVPIEVDFEYKTSSYQDCPTTPDESLRRLFQRTLPPLIEVFFKKIHKKPQHVNMYPIGEAIPKHVKQIYTHIRVEHSLAMDYNRVSQSVPLMGNLVEQTILHIAAAMPEAAALATDLYIEIRQLPNRLVQGESVTELWHHIKEKLSTSTLPDEILEQGGNQGQEQELYATSKMKASWTNIIVSAACFQELVGDMQECANKISEGATVSNHDLYYMVSQMTVAMKLLSVHQTEMETLRNLILKRHGDDSASLQRWLINAGAVCLSSAFICLLSAAICFTGGFAVAPILSIALSGCSTVVAGRFAFKVKDEIVETGRKKGTVSDLDNMVPQLGQALGQAQIALSALFCSQVLKMPLDLMPRTERKEILQNLGVDVTELGNEPYVQELVVDRIKRFATVYNQFEEKRKEVGCDVGLRDAKEATVKTSC